MAKARGQHNNDPLAKRPKETHAQWQMRLALAGVTQDTKEERATPNTFAKLHGDYQDRFVMHAETATRAKALVNRGGDPVSRWEAAGKLEPHQMLAIEKLRNIWELIGVKQRVTANYGVRLGGSGDAEHAVSLKLDAKDDLKRIEGYFPAPLDSYFAIFENVVRRHYPAGIAGAGEGRSEKTAQARALTIVQFVADIIATRERL